MKYFIIVAATQNKLGIGMNGKLPWTLRKEMSHFSRMTTLIADFKKMNAVIMGRKTWESIPEMFRPLKKRINIVLSSSDSNNFPPEVKVCSSFEKAREILNESPLKEIVYNVWIIGGTSVYEEALKNDWCDRIYVTWIKKDFECDTFFPKIPDTFKEINDKNVSSGEKEENGIQYEYKVYEKDDDPEPEKDDNPEPEKDDNPEPEKDDDPEPEKDDDPEPEKDDDPEPGKDGDPGPEQES